MKKLGFLMMLLAMAVMLGGTASAQDYSYYFTTYYSNANTANAPDATVRIINDGFTGTNIYAAIFVFDDSEELTECCDCEITPDSLLSESANGDLSPTTRVSTSGCSVPSNVSPPRTCQRTDKGENLTV